MTKRFVSLFLLAFLAVAVFSCPTWASAFSQPQKPSDPIPADNAVDVPLDQTLSWARCYNEDGTPIAGYTIQVRNEKGTYMSSGSISSIGPSRITFETSGFYPGDKYTWEVSARDNKGSTWKSKFSFTTTAVALQTGKAILAYSIPGQVSSIIDSSAHTVTVTMPSGTDVSSMVAEFTLSDGASSEVGGVAQISKKTANDFTNPVTYRVTAEDKSVRDWVVTVNVAPAPRIGKDITSYSIPGQVSSIIDSSAHTVTVTMPSGTDVSSMVAEFTLSGGASSEVDGVAQISKKTANDFTNPVTYRVTAEDKSVQNWVVTVNVAPAPRIGKDITSYSVPGQVSSIIDSSAHTVTVTMPSGTDVSSMVAEFTLSDGASSEVGGVAQISKKTANDFTNPVTYRVTAEDKSVRDWVVTVNVAPAPRVGKDITSYSIPGQVSSIIDSSAHTVTVTMPSGTDVSSLVADFTLSDGASAEIGSLSQESGVTANDFTSPVSYKIIAEDKSFLNWTVTVYLDTDPVTPVIPKVEPSDIEPFKLEDEDISSDSGAKPMTSSETADIVNGNGDLLKLFSEDKVAEIVAVNLDGDVKDIKFPAKKDHAKNVTDIAVKYEGSQAITPVIVQIKNNDSDDGDNFDLSLPVAQIRSLMANVSNNTLTFRLKISSKESVIMFNGRNLVAERLATVEEKDGEYYVVVNVSNRPGTGLTFEDLSGSVFAVDTEEHLIQTIMEKIGSRNYSYQDLVNMGLLNLDSFKWYEYKSEIDKLVDPVKEDIQKAIDAINTAKPVPASSGSGGAGCSIGGIAPAALFLLLPLLLFQKK
ncbi:hypothetical protein Dpep_2381 [Dethiosulfovibrio peptidovorans DSM 11002]|uniref:Fibronectin type-III domain-containing protein n=1 Tax=Dethiosulfovibrio peptidovorans DSM 11002 TaxID=469381 RepID=D2Z4Q9_9BACT|nr:Synerg-CTERM sorting domain-containing protein [Dethiosulfovibrio peptidovorans]EFC92403.1 hypothetical protein Dpep_2381 [Dethiosulfovibrio peptidovorans DSM 11002]